jgi:uncharacterized protein YndB with AHSA1/START domain
MEVISSDEIVQEIFIESPPERIFQALTNPEELVQWWGDEESYRCTSWTGELIVGGHWRTEGVGKNGNPFSVEGEYEEIDPPKQLVYSWNPSWHNVCAKVRWILTPKGTGTNLVVIFSGFAGNEEAHRDHIGGLPSVLNWLKKYLS